MNKQHAEITIILDGSGSMETMKEAVVEGFNGYVDRMRETPGDTTWTLVRFDDPSSSIGAGEQFPHVIFKDKGETEVPRMAGFHPRGGTALVDAVCITLIDIRKRWEKDFESIKPIVMIITDGEENSSRVHTTDEMREMIGGMTASGAQFIYMGANQDSFAVAHKYNMTGTMSCGGQGTVNTGGLLSGAVNFFNYTPTAAGMKQAISSGMRGCIATVSGSVNVGKLNPVEWSC